MGVGGAGSRRRLRTLVGVGVALIILAAVAVAPRSFGGADAPRPPAGAQPPGTAAVTRATLTPDRAASRGRAAATRPSRSTT